MSRSEASTLSGAAMPAGVARSVGQGKLCVYTRPSDSTVTIVVTTAPDVATARHGLAEVIAQVKATAGQDSGLSTQQQPVPGIGDAAYASVSTGKAATTIGVSAVDFVKGTVVVAVEVTTSGRVPPSLATMIAEGHTVADRVG